MEVVVEEHNWTSSQVLLQRSMPRHCCKGCCKGCCRGHGRDLAIGYRRETWCYGHDYIILCGKIVPLYSTHVDKVQGLDDDVKKGRITFNPWD